MICRPALSRIVCLILCCLLIVASPARAEVRFQHPGVLLDRARLDFIKQQVSAGTEPFASAFKAARESKSGSLSYLPEGPPADHFILCGSYSNPNHGCTAEDKDATAAYLQAILWYLTDNPAYAENAILIMNTYAKSLTEGHRQSNAPLQAAWTAEKWPAAAEIIRYTYDGWKPADISAFSTLLQTQYLPYLTAHHGEGKNGNWQLSMIDGMLGIAIFTEDQALYAQAIGLWQKWVPAYVYHFALDGEQPVRFAGSPRDWNGQRVFNAGTSGVTQETCRDLGHTFLGVVALTNAAETAYIQGTDLFTPAQLRLTTMLEYHARLLRGVRNKSGNNKLEVPAGFDGLCDGSYVPVLRGAFERAYNAYHVRMGVDLPETKAFLIEDMRPHAPPSDQHIVLWETLTHADSPRTSRPK